MTANEDLVTNPEVFTDGYVPDEMPGRETEIRHLQLMFRRGSGNATIMGQTGSGKTAVIKYLSRQMPKNRPVYIGCTPKSTLRALFCHLADEWNINYSDIHHSADDILKRVQPKTPNSFHVVLDDIDRVNPHEACNILKGQEDSLPSMSLILITNKVGTFDTLAERCPDCWRRLAPRQLGFAPYRKSTLCKILAERCEKGLTEGAADLGIIKLIASRVTHHTDGDARVAIRALHLAADNASADGRDEITENDCYAGLQAVTAEDQTNKLNILTDVQKIVLLAVLIKPGYGGKICYQNANYIRKEVWHDISHISKKAIWRALNALEDARLIRPQYRDTPHRTYVPAMNEQVQQKLIDLLAYEFELEIEIRGGEK